MDVTFSVSDFILNPPEEFALLGLPSGDLKVLVGPFTAHEGIQKNKVNVYLDDFFLSSDAPFLTGCCDFLVPAEARKLAAQLSLGSPPKISWSNNSQSDFIESFKFFRDLLASKILSKVVNKSC